MLVVLIHEATYFLLLNSLQVGFPRSTYYPPSIGGNNTIAVVSLHRGHKFYGYMGRWLAQNKYHYARLHDYSYFGEGGFPDSTHLYPLSKYRNDHHRGVDFDKYRYLLYLMERHSSSLRYLLWLDADIVFTQATISIQDRMRLFRKKHLSEEDFCLVWAQDSSTPSASVLLFTNTPMTRQLIRTSLSTLAEQQVSMDQAFTQTVQNNATYAACQQLLVGDDSRLLQSHVLGKTATLWTHGDWTLHLQNHNHVEMLLSLYSWIGRTVPNSRKCLRLQPVPYPDISYLPAIQQERFEAVRQAIEHAWKGYRKMAFPQDDLAPISKTGITWLNYAATLHDSIDTLYLANLTRDYEEAVSLTTSYDIQTTSLRVTKTFEYSLRVVGGLLGAYSLSGDPRLLAAARRAADALLEGPFRASPTVLPRPFGMLAPNKGGYVYRLVATLYNWGRDKFTNEHRTNSLAGVGSFSLEFNFLSSATGDPRYRRATDAIFHHVKSQERRGTIATSWNVMTGQMITSGANTNLGSAADSFYEYLLKVPLLNGCKLQEDNGGAKTRECSETDSEMLSLYRRMVQQSLRTDHVARRRFEGMDVVSLPVDNGNSYHHLLCFLPGLLAIGASEKITHNADMVLAKDLLAGCSATYDFAAAKLGPESLSLPRDPNKPISKATVNLADPSYLLRPEFIESVFVLYRLTKDPKFQEIGWAMFEHLEKFCKISGGGYRGLKNVMATNMSGVDNAIDDMPSYFIAETLKYLILLFGPDEYIGLEDFVFTTEAHPLRKLEFGFDELPLCLESTEAPLPTPWTLYFCVVCFGTLLACLFSLCTGSHHQLSKSKGS